MGFLEEVHGSFRSRARTKTRVSALFKPNGSRKSTTIHLLLRKDTAGRRQTVVLEDEALMEVELVSRR